MVINSNLADKVTCEILVLKKTIKSFLQVISTAALLCTIELNAHFVLIKSLNGLTLPFLSELLRLEVLCPVVAVFKTLYK